jgi:general secretion pathway protein A
MYKDFFRLKEMPFSIAPDPRFLFMSERHREALAHLLYGVQGAGGIVLLTGEVGTGKTTLCRSLLEQLPENIDVAFILNPRMNVEELLQTICEEYHIHIPFDRFGIKTFVDALNARLLETHALGRHAILIVDEAQNLDTKVIEQLRLLTNLETNTHKLLQIFLIGQPELQGLLAQPEMRQVSQRVIARYHLSHLNQSEVQAYVAHRLRISGTTQQIFPEAVTKNLYRASGGVPRLINLICDRALLGAYVQGQQQVTQPVLRQAISEVLVRSRRQRPWAMAAVLLVLLMGLASLLIAQLSDAKFSWLPSLFASTPSPVVEIVPTSPLAVSVPLASAATLPASGSFPASTLNWLSNIANNDSEILAFQSLFKLYGIDINTQSGVAPCAQAEVRGVRCYAGHGDLMDLYNLDQPVLVRLSSPGGKEYSAALTALDHQAATLSIGVTTQRVALNKLAESWFGQFVVLWNVPPNFKEPLFANQHGLTVTWLRHAMEIADGIRDNGSDVFDATLARRVRAFQLSSGIKPDGLVGPLTVIRLNMLSGKAGPPLVTEKRD